MIYVITHKDVLYKLPKNYALLKVGNNSCSKYDFSDNTGDNISDKNTSFCELTGLYWIWKNRTNESIVGLVHYRRFFINHIHHKIDRRIPFKQRILSFRKARRILKEYDIIVPQKLFFDSTVRKQYAKCHFDKDIDTVREIIDEIYPEYIQAFDKVMNDNSIYACNMFITRFDIIDDYCLWLYSILFEAEKKIDITDYNQYQKRIFGFLAERLFNVYCTHNSFHVYYATVHTID